MRKSILLLKIRNTYLVKETSKQNVDFKFYTILNFMYVIIIHIMSNKRERVIRTCSYLYLLHRVF